MSHNHPPRVASCVPATLLAGLLAATSGCTIVFGSLPTSPHLTQLGPEQVFAKAPPAEWHEPTRDDPAQASIDVACGVGPRLRDGTIYAAVSVRGRPPRSAIAPLNVSLVLDRSGSMHGQPFSNMLQAAEAFVGQFRDGDRVSVVVFSNGVYEAAPPVVLDANTRPAVIAAIRMLHDGGGTNISGGLLGGLWEVFSFFSEWQVNQVVFFSDGQPTDGITDRRRLVELAWRAAEHGAGITSIGFGPEHDELLMQALADAGGGAYHYIDSVNDIPALFQREAAEMLRVAARTTVVQVALPAGLELQDVIGYDYFVGQGRVWIRMGAVPHDQERYLVMRFRSTAAGPSALPMGLAYSDMARRAKFGVNCQPSFRLDAGGGDRWALELAGHAEAYWGLSESMGWADNGSEVFVISQIAHTRGLIVGLREVLGAAALGPEDQMLAEAQVKLGLNVAAGAAQATMSRGLGGLLDFGKQQAMSNATTAVVAKADANFRPLLRAAVATSWYGQPVMFYSARTQRPFKFHDGDRNRTYKRARYDSYVNMRVRVRVGG